MSDKLQDLLQKSDSKNNVRPSLRRSAMFIAQRAISSGSVQKERHGDPRQVRTNAALQNRAELINRVEL